jgi:hypothetical protein
MSEFPDFEPQLRKDIVIVDLDGTLCDHSHRLHLALAGQWNEYHALCVDDKINEDVSWFLSMLKPDCFVIVLSGREESVKDQTIQWLVKHDVARFIDEILLRPIGDYTPDIILKPAMMDDYFNGLNWHSRVLVALDDRDKMIECWRLLGIPAWQVRQGLI